MTKEFIQEGEEFKTITEKLYFIQSKLSVKKNQKNKFGNYSYRTAEDIYTAFKEVVNKYDLNIKDVESLKCNTHPHQIYFEILSEHGLFGLMIMLSMLFTFIYHNLYYVYKSKNIFLTSMFILIIVTFIPLLPGGSFFTSFNATLFWINFSFYYVYKNICNQIK